jgi:outer membrane protein OmpA-like peptidoglycan-associated protein
MDAMSCLSRRLARLLVALSLAASAVASAQPIQDRSFSPQVFHPAPGPDEFISVESAVPLGHRGFAFGLFFNYARNEFSILGYDPTKMSTTSDRADLIKAAIGADLWAAYGLWNRFQLALAIPMTLYQTGNDLTDPNRAAPVKAPSGFAFGDPRIHLKVRFYGKERGLQVGLSHWLSIPLGNDGDFGGEKHFTGVAGEARVLAGWEAERWHLGAFIGINWRAHTSTFFSTVAGQQLTYGGAFAFDVLVQRLRLVAEIYGHSNSFDSVTFPSATNATGKISITDINDAPLELDVAAKFFVIPGLSLNLGVGNGLIAGLGSPQPRVYLGAVYAPDRRDRDHDGVPDSIDKCPDVPEDKDGFQDDDGCPDPDNDNDTILDRDDKCPNQAEDFDQFEDEDGCPDPDNDKDGIDDLHDACPNDPEDHLPPKPNDGCPVSKTDTDGDGIMDNVDKCPTDPEDKDGFQDEDGCPDPDNDNDGIPDGFDNCPNDPEDLDGFEDEDGCPDPDNDHDGILDKDDKCPNEPETINGYQDEDGCPDKGPPSKVKIENGQIVILEKIFFDTDKAVIKSKSFNVLNQVAQVIKAHPEFKIRVEGHTDSQGNATHNTKLSQNRADSVLMYLSKHGVAPERLIAVGYGPSAPIADNKTSKGREANRRVEFHIIEEPKQQPQQPAGDENKTENQGELKE